MKLWYVETYDNYDWDYHVFADSEEEVKTKLNNFWVNNDIEPKTIHKINGPYKFSDDVLSAREPNL